MSTSAPSASPARRAAAWGGAYLALLIFVFAAYHGTLRQFFVADDFTHLAFLREVRAPLHCYLDPTFIYSDPVTSARYLPIKIYCLLFFERAFGLHALPYHLASILLHALNALLAGHLAGTVFRDRVTGAVAAILFASSRLAAQNVCWMVCIPNLLGAALLFAAVAIYLRREAGLGSGVLAALLLLMSFLCRSDAAVSVAFLLPWWTRDAVIERRRASWGFVIGAAIAAGIALVLGAVSLRYFPEPKMRLGFEPRRFLVFLADLFAPGNIPAAAKVVAVIVVLGAAGLARDRRVLYALWGVALGAAMWTVVVYLKLTPRYFYVYTALSSMIVASLVVRAARRLLASRGEIAALALALLVAGWSARSIARYDVVWFDYLSTPGRKLVALMEQRRAEGATEPLRVTMTPHPLLIDADGAFFKPYLVVVRDGTHTATVDTEAARFVSYYGEDFGKAFWYFPWFWDG